MVIYVLAQHHDASFDATRKVFSKMLKIPRSGREWKNKSNSRNIIIVCKMVTRKTLQALINDVSGIDYRYFAGKHRLSGFHIGPDMPVSTYRHLGWRQRHHIYAK